LNFFRNFIRLFDGTLSCFGVIASIMIFLAMLGVTANVFLRYVFVSPIQWMLEVTEYLLLWITFLGAAWLLRDEGHVKMGLILDRLAPRTQSLINTITSIVAAIACFILAWYGTELTIDMFQRRLYRLTILSPLFFYIVAIIPIGSYLLSIEFLRKSYAHLKNWRVLKG